MLECTEVEDVGVRVDEPREQGGAVELDRGRAPARLRALSAAPIAEDSSVAHRERLGPRGAPVQRTDRPTREHDGFACGHLSQGEGGCAVRR